MYEFLGQKETKELRKKIRNASKNQDKLIKVLEDVVKNYDVIHNQTELPFEDIIVEKGCDKLNCLFYMNWSRNLTPKDFSYQVSFRKKRLYSTGTRICIIE